MEQTRKIWNNMKVKDRQALKWCQVLCKAKCEGSKRTFAHLSLQKQLLYLI